MRLAPTLRVPSPVFRQIKPAVDQRLAETAGVGDEHAHLAILDPPRRARILSRHPDRVFAFLEKAGLVNDEHAIGIAQRLKRIVPNHITQVVRRPGTASQKRLHPIGPSKSSLLGHQPARLALHARKQAINKGPRAIAQFAPWKRRPHTRLNTNPQER